jgi:cell division protein FtsB
MGLFQKKHDPISEKARALTEQIEALEAQIRQLSTEAASPQPRFRSSTAPGGFSTRVPAPAGGPPEAREHFEPVDHTPLQSPAPAPTREHFNELGVRKFDLVAAWRKLKEQFKTPPASNPKLVNYLAAGSIQGLRPLRYEKRVARNRFIFLVVVLVLVLWGILAVVFRR